MKFFCGATLALLSCSVVAQESLPYAYPASIECKPVRVMSVSLLKGIVEDKKLVDSIRIQYVHAGEGIYTSPTGAGRFPTKHTNQGYVLNIYSDESTFSVTLNEGVYVNVFHLRALVLKSGKVVGGTAYGTLSDGDCDLRWN